MIIQTGIAILGGEVAVENALGHTAAFDAKTVPFTHLQPPVGDPLKRQAYQSTQNEGSNHIDLWNSQDPGDGVVSLRRTTISKVLD
jgi:hypothetical protein